MKKIIGVTILTAVLLLTITGCGGDKKDDSAKAQTKIAAQSDKAAESKDKQTSADSTQAKQQNTRANLRGEVSAIDGSKIELKLIEMPERRNAQQGAGNRQNNKQESDGKKDNEKDQTNDQERQERRNQQRQANSNRQPPAPKFTGENKTITVTDAVSITTTVRGENGRQQKELKLSDLKQGDILQVWLSDKDKETVSKIVVTPRRSNQGNAKAQDKTE